MTAHVTSTAADELDFARFTRSLWRARLALLAIPLVAAAIAWIATARAPARYRATISMAAVTAWAAPVDPAGIAALRAAAESGATAVSPGIAGPPRAAVSVEGPGSGNTFAVNIVDATPDGAVRTANAVGAAMPERMRNLRQSSQNALAATGEEEVEAARRRFRSAAEQMGRFLAATRLRVVDGEPVALDGRPVPAEVRVRFSEVQADEYVARSAYSQALSWQQDMRRQAGARIPEVVLLQPAASAQKIGPWPVRAAAIAALVALLATAGACLAWEALRSSLPPARAAHSTERL